MDSKDIASPTQPSPTKKPSRLSLRRLVVFGVVLAIGYSPLPPIVKDGLYSILRAAGLTDGLTPRTIVAPPVRTD
jgi:hypothetical protein